MRAKAIITFTHSGYTAFHLSNHRPEADIYAFTNNKILLQYLSLAWGVRAFYLSTYEQLEEAISESVKILKEKGLLIKGDCVVHIGSLPLNEHGKTSMLKVSNVL